MKRSLMGLLTFIFTGCSAADNFNVIYPIEGIYSLEVECVEPENNPRQFEKDDWYIFEEGDDLLVTGRYGNFVAKKEENEIICQDFGGINYVIDFEGTYDSDNLDGYMHREYRDYDLVTTLHLWGERELWGDPDDYMEDVEGFYPLEAEIIYQDCIKEEYQENFFPSPYPYPILVFQRDNALYFWGYGLRKQINAENDGSFFDEKVNENLRATSYSQFEGNISEDFLEGTFSYSYDFFNNGNIECRSEIYVYGEEIDPWNEPEYMEEVFSNYRKIFFTAQDYVMFKR